MYQQFVSGAAGEVFFCDPNGQLPDPQPIPARPNIRVPRSAKRDYGHDELCAAASMMEKLRRREDQRNVSLTDVNHDPVEVTVNRLMMLLGT